MYYLVYLKETDGDIIIEPYNEYMGLMARAKELKLHPSEYSIFKGTCIKAM